MDPVQRVAYRVTTLRTGRVVETLDRASVSPSEMLRLMAPAAAEEIAHGR
jgi:ABC-type uncharacterized transport system ATPase subunit